MIYRKFTIVCKGKDESGVERALEEALQKISEGCTSGFDSADDGAFYFDVTDDVPKKERPA